MRIARGLPCLLLLATGAVPADPVPVAPAPWSFYAGASAYLLEGEDDYVQPTVYADAGRVHLEARFNYEDQDTGSVWIGYNAGVGSELRLEFTPMLGVVFGGTSGIAPGYKASISWRDFELYSESEYVFDLDESGDSFLYTWTELTVSPSDGWRMGFVVQRSRAYEAERDIQRGLLLGCTLGRFDLTASVLNPDDVPTWVLALGAGF